MEPGALAEFAAAAHVHKDLTDRFLEPMDVDSLSGRGGGEREAWKFSYLGRFFECWCKASRPEWHSCAFIGKNQLYVFMHPLSLGPPSLPPAPQSQPSGSSEPELSPLCYLAASH